MYKTAALSLAVAQTDALASKHMLDLKILKRNVADPTLKPFIRQTVSY